ncbi:MAG: hypothetical protein KC561_17690, partial [Myxococcales bacterium]|nr:hypothetical protein [Myxococcales bacterium]
MATRGIDATTRIRLTTALAVVMLCLCALSASAQEPRRHVEEYEAGSTSQQLAVDDEPVDIGQGAIFVPSRSRSTLEPQVRVYLGDSLVARGPTGQRLALPAGQYRVAIGQGPYSWRPSAAVAVYPDETTVADDFFGSLRVTAIGSNGEPVAVDYTLVSADGSRVYGPATTSDDLDYGETRTWILQPGTYRIVPGNRPLGTVGTITTVVSADQRARIRLLTNGEGDVVGSEPGDYESIATFSDWRLRWTIGGSGSLGQSSGQLNGFS